MRRYVRESPPAYRSLTRYSTLKWGTWCSDKFLPSFWSLPHVVREWDLFSTQKTMKYTPWKINVLNQKIKVCNNDLPFQFGDFRFHVNFQECKQPFVLQSQLILVIFHCNLELQLIMLINLTPQFRARIRSYCISCEIFQSRWEGSLRERWTVNVILLHIWK